MCQKYKYSSAPTGVDTSSGVKITSVVVERKIFCLSCAASSWVSHLTRSTKWRPLLPVGGSYTWNNQALSVVNMRGEMTLQTQFVVSSVAKVEWLHGRSCRYCWVVNLKGLNRWDASRKKNCSMFHSSKSAFRIHNRSLYRWLPSHSHSSTMGLLLTLKIVAIIIVNISFSAANDTWHARRETVMLIYVVCFKVMHREGAT